jgi:hypothetical protein
MAAVFPASLPWFTRFVLSPAGQRAATKPPKHVVQRSSTADGWAMAEVSWVLFEEHRVAFEEWFRDELNRGASWALMKLPITPGGIAGDGYSAVRFPAGYSKTLVVNGLWRVSAQIVIRDRFEGALPGCFYERFTSGLGPYSLVTGTLAPFSIGGSVQGSTLDIAANGDVTPPSIKRSFAPRTVVSVRARFLIVAPDFNNDSAVITVSTGAGALIAGVTPRTEVSFDALRRVGLHVGGESLAAGAGPVSFGEWHEARFALAAGAGNSSYAVTNLETSAVLASGHFSGDHALKVGEALGFYFSPGPITSVATRFADIEVC